MVEELMDDPPADAPGDGGGREGVTADHPGN
jgi:hypothetical protein